MWMGLETAHMSHRMCTRTPCYSLRLKTPVLFTTIGGVAHLYGLQTYLYLNLARLFFSDSKVYWQFVETSPVTSMSVAWWSMWTALSISDTPVGYLQRAANTQWIRGGVWKTWKRLILVGIAIAVPKHYLWGFPDLALLRWTKFNYHSGTSFFFK